MTTAGTPDAPPPVLDGARVIAWAIVDDSVRWTGRQKLFRGDVPIGAMPRLALCQNLHGLQDILLFHCDATWNVEAVSGSPTLEDTKAMAERAYAGIGARWVPLDLPVQQAREWLATSDDGTSALRCAFCDATAFERQRFVTSRGVAICDVCIEGFRRELQASATPAPTGDNPA